MTGLAASGRLADYLAAWGEQGEVGVDCTCVLANHLWRRLEVDADISYRRTGDPDRLEVLSPDGTILAEVPYLLTKFVREFDAGRYPELILEAENGRTEPSCSAAGAEPDQGGGSALPHAQDQHPDVLLGGAGDGQE